MRLCVFYVCVRMLVIVVQLVSVRCIATALGGYNLCGNGVTKTCSMLPMKCLMLYIHEWNETSYPEAMCTTD